MGMFVFHNPNPSGKRVGDCVARAMSKAVGVSWLSAYVELCVMGVVHSDMPTANNVWGAYLRSKGFRRYPVEDTGDIYTVADFCRDHPRGVYVLALDGHVVAVENGDWYDTWDSGDGVPIFYWVREDDANGE